MPTTKPAKKRTRKKAEEVKPSDPVILSIAPATDRPKVTGVQKVVRAEQEKTALQLRRQGQSLEVIAQRLQVSPGSARKILDRALGRLVRHTPQSIEKLRALEGERLDTLLVRVNQLIDATGKDAVDAILLTQLIDRALKIGERRDRLYGLSRTPVVPMPDAETQAAEILLPGLRGATVEELEQVRAAFAAAAARRAEEAKAQEVAS